MIHSFRNFPLAGNLPVLCILVCTLGLATSAAAAPIYDCTIGVYSNAIGELSLDYPWPAFEIHDIYVVLHAEATAAGAAYRLTMSPQFVVIPYSFGPDGDAIHIQDPEGAGDWVGFGQCALGFGGEPVLIAHYQALVIMTVNLPLYIRPEANWREHPLVPVYADCANHIVPCAPIPFIFLTVETSATSFGGIKALYGN